MPELFLGIDTSNYTSSCAVYNKDEDSFVSLKKLLPVNEGQLGLRQSDAVFHHTKNLPPLLYELVSGCNEISCVSASFAPCDREGSYMPCFSVGQGFGKVLSGAYNSKYYEFSHQAGHVAAAIHSSGHTELIDKEFLAFHVSGGTTEILYVKPDTDKPFEITQIASTLDLKAGQAVDRAGVMMGLKFPAGPELDKLANMSDKQYKIRPFTKDGCCSFSGLENQCRKMLSNGEQQCDVAKYCIDYVCTAVRIMTQDALKKYGELPVVFAGGVMSNSIMRKVLSQEFGAYFAKPEFSSDNAAGTAYLGYIKEYCR